MFGELVVCPRCDLRQESCPRCRKCGHPLGEASDRTRGSTAGAGIAGALGSFLRRRFEGGMRDTLSLPNPLGLLGGIIVLVAVWAASRWTDIPGRVALAMWAAAAALVTLPGGTWLATKNRRLALRVALRVFLYVATVAFGLALCLAGLLLMMPWK